MPAFLSNNISCFTDQKVGCFMMTSDTSHESSPFSPRQSLAQTPRRFGKSYMQRLCILDSHLYERLNICMRLNTCMHAHLHTCTSTGRSIISTFSTASSSSLSSSSNSSSYQPHPDHHLHSALHHSCSSVLTTIELKSYM